MTTWLLIIQVFATSLHAVDGYSSIRFNSKAACEKQANELNGYVIGDSRHDGYMRQCEAWCVEDKAGK